MTISHTRLTWWYWPWRLVLVLAALAVGWLAVSLQVADHYARLAAAGDRPAADLALSWDSTQPRALELKARYMLRSVVDENDIDEATLASARELLQRAATADSARGNVAAMAALVHQRLESGHGESYATLANRLAPVEPRVQQNLAGYALNSGQLSQAVVHMARTLVGNRDTKDAYFPLLMRVAADPQARAVLTAIASDPIPFPWWIDFFTYVAREAEDLNALRNLVALREASVALPLQEVERDMYIRRLRQEGLMSEAYLHWVNSLSKEQLGVLGYLYDGSFEYAPDNDSGFGWVVQPQGKSGIRVNRGSTYGATGEVAMRVSFRGMRARFSHVYQHIFLPPGKYTVSGRARPDKLEGRRGLQWRVSCTAVKGEVLGESDLFLGTGDWRRFDFELNVPATCAGQILRLYSAGDRAVDHELKGAIWFDDLKIERSK